MAAFCRSCSVKMGGIFGEAKAVGDPELCFPCYSKMTKELEVARKGEDSEVDPERDKASHLPISTAYSLAEYDIVREIDVITAECAFGINLFRDFFASVRDVFGGRSIATQKVLRDARKTCLLELRKEALEVGADGVIGVALDYQEFSGAGKSMLFLVASGTAVALKKQKNNV